MLFRFIRCRCYLDFQLGIKPHSECAVMISYFYDKFNAFCNSLPPVTFLGILGLLFAFLVAFAFQCFLFYVLYPRIVNFITGNND